MLEIRAKSTQTCLKTLSGAGRKEWSMTSRRVTIALSFLMSLVVLNSSQALAAVSEGSSSRTFYRYSNVEHPSLGLSISADGKAMVINDQTHETTDCGSSDTRCIASEGVKITLSNHPVDGESARVSGGDRFMSPYSFLGFPRDIESRVVEHDGSVFTTWQSRSRGLLAIMIAQGGDKAFLLLRGDKGFWNAADREEAAPGVIEGAPSGLRE